MLQKFLTGELAFLVLTVQATPIVQWSASALNADVALVSNDRLDRRPGITLFVGKAVVLGQCAEIQPRDLFDPTRRPPYFE